MENLIFSLNATMPIFLMMVIGYILNKLGAFDRQFADKVNKFVFKIALPVLLFKDLSNSNFSEAWDTKFVLFCFGATLVSILIVIFISKFLNNKNIRGEFVQAAYRSSAALIGCAFIQNIYGTSGNAPLMIIGSVPLYNIIAVTVLTLMSPENKGEINKEIIIKSLKGIAKNPIIIGIAAGMVWSLLKLPQIQIMKTTVSSLGATATPLGLMALGASFDFKSSEKCLKPAIVCSIFKLVIFTAVFIGPAISLGFREDKLISILVMLGGATTVSSFTMAKSMGHEGNLSALVVMITTLASAFTLTGWVYILKCMGMI